MSDFSMDDLKTKIQESAITQMAALLPAEQLIQLINQAIDKFFEPTTRFQLESRCQGTGWRDTIRETTFTISPFEAMVWNGLTPIIQKAVDDYFTSKKEELQDHAKKIIESPSIEKLNAESVGIITDRITEARTVMVAAHAVDVLRNDLRDTLNRQNVYI